MVQGAPVVLSPSKAIGVALLAIALGQSVPSCARDAEPVAATARIDAEPASAQQLSANAALDRLFAEDARATMALDPLAALEQGQHVPISQFELLFTPALASRQRDANTRALAALAQIDRSRLDPARRISHAVFEETKHNEQALLTAEMQALTAVQPFNHFGGFHIAYPELSARGGTSLNTAADYDLLIARHRALRQVFGQAITRFREGMATGVTEPRLIVDNMIVQIDGLLAQPIARSP